MVPIILVILSDHRCIRWMETTDSCRIWLLPTMETHRACKGEGCLLLALDYAMQILMATPKFEVVKSKLGWTQETIGRWDSVLIHEHLCTLGKSYYIGRPQTDTPIQEISEPVFLLRKTFQMLEKKNYYFVHEPGKKYITFCISLFCCWFPLPYGVSGYFTFKYCHHCVRAFKPIRQSSTNGIFLWNDLCFHRLRCGVATLKASN